jgi:hypothetical protein
VLAETTVRLLIVAVHIGLKNVKYAFPLDNTPLEFVVRGYTSTMLVVWFRLPAISWKISFQINPVV